MFYTTNNGNLYAIATRLNSTSVVIDHVPFPKLNMKVTMLGSDKNLKWRYFAGKLIINISPLFPAEINKVKSAWVFKLEGYANR